MKPAKSMRPPLPGSPTRNTCIFTTSPNPNCMDFSCAPIASSTASAWVLVSP
jgi:hypothetical protein